MEVEFSSVVQVMVAPVAVVAEAMAEMTGGVVSPGVTPFELPDAVEVPTALCAVTLKV